MAISNSENGRCNTVVFEKNGMAYISGNGNLNAHLPTLVFIHGSGQCGMFWEMQINGLSDIVNTIAVDLPGHGKSKGTGFESVEDYGKTVFELIRSINAPHPVLCGLSIGGAIVQHLLLKHRGFFRAGILINTGARLKVLPLIMDTVRKNHRAYLKMLIHMGVAEENRSDALLCKKILACSNAEPGVTAGDFKACHEFDTMATIHGIAIPVLVLSAEKDALTPVKYGSWLARHIRTAQHVIIGKAGHMSPMEQPDAVNKAIRKFIQSMK